MRHEEHWSYFLCLFCFVSCNKIWKKKNNNKKKPQNYNYCLNCCLGNAFFKAVCSLWYFIICSKHHLLKGEMIVSMPNLLQSCVGSSQLFRSSVPSAGTWCIKHISDEVQEIRKWEMLFLASVVTLYQMKTGRVNWRNQSWGSWQILGNSK